MQVRRRVHRPCTDFYKGDARTPRGRAGQSLRGSSALHGWAENSLYLFHLGKNRFRIEPESKDESDSQEFEIEITDTDNDGVQLVRHELDDAYTDLGRWMAFEGALVAAAGGEVTAKEAGCVDGLREEHCEDAPIALGDSRGAS